jgi:phosphomannomutase
MNFRTKENPLLSPIKFGTDGWRGVIADVYTYDNVRIVARATAQYLKSINAPADGVVVVGYDHRFESEDFAALAAHQIAAAGYKVLLSEYACPSPTTSLITHDRKALLGVMITASHNPPRYNGYKLKASYGGSATPDLTDPIQAAAQAMDSAPEPEPAAYDGRIEKADFKPHYMDVITGLVDADTIKKVKGPVLVDVMYGSASGYLTPWLQGIGVDAREFRGERNPWFGGVNPEPLPENLGATAEEVKRIGAKIATVADGDADRVAAMDENGRFVNPHEVFALLLMHLVEDKGLRGTVAQTISSTTMVTKLAEDYGLPVIKTPVGFKWLADLFMTNPDMLIGGEESGGIGIRGYIPERDAQLNALLLLEMMAHRGKSLKELVDDLWAKVGFHCYDRRDLHLTEDTIDHIRDRVKAAAHTDLAGLKVKDINRKDGTRFNFEDGSWLLVRPSGTEPVVRVYAESTTCEKVQKLLDDGVAMCR